MNFCGLAKINLRRLAGEPLFTSTDYESISKSFEEDDEASELNKAEEVLGVVLPMDQDAALRVDEAFLFIQRASVAKLVSDIHQHRRRTSS